MNDPSKNPLPPRPPANAVPERPPANAVPERPPANAMPPAEPSASGPKIIEGPQMARGPQVAPKAGQDSQAGKNAAYGALGVLGIALFKFKALGLIGLKLLTSFKLLVFFKSFISMFIMLGIYTMMFGWVYAFIIVGLLLIHELGHFVWMKANGLNPRSIIFMPFAGAAAVSDQPDNQSLNAWVAMAGPLIGGLTSIGLFYFGQARELNVMMAAGWTGVMLNLFQLVPAKPFDGGHILGAISKWFLLPGTLVVFTLAALWHTPLMFIIALISAYSVFMIFTGRDKSQLTMRPAKPLDKFAIACTYMGLVLILGFVYAQADAHLIKILKTL
ncbi:MAG: hypothetical protein IPP57_26945 [Candidatus Obscuribacter sp.]|jgi:Zn-dependent protease|nr:hypothetical protein [Candidatus Obscuribacter sp.]MDQ5965804.1 hypothetical protein [Cyanobacteriota bacterium erpe_2018_sw_39hr_WHONDRS-SW48-000098_B_bin.30]MBK7841398.1 hypothetical protein [Candidatus Obscuribacter sp.]MBK9204626.1 hypothetical protein [Candidatus Obscuribacter sp.]MBK9622247.1 hypothetical protein [Candidatus Obscuribacter sp.]